MRRMTEFNSAYGGYRTRQHVFNEEAIQKLAEYENIGTVSEFQQLKEKATAKFSPCPKCGSVRSLGDGFCYDCGTILD